MKASCLMAVLACWLSTSCLAQQSGNVEDEPGPSIPAMDGRIGVRPAVDLPMGVGAKLGVFHTRVKRPTYSWSTTCNAPMRPDHWLQAGIFTGCVGDPGAWEFEATVSHASKNVVLSPGKWTKIVTWHPPDDYDLQIHPPRTFWPGLPYEQVITLIEVTLLWEGAPIGRCARACVQEQWEFTPHKDFEHLIELSDRQEVSLRKWWPTCTMRSSSAHVSGSQQAPVATWQWQAPRLLDFNSLGLTHTDWSQYEKDSLLGTQEHKYQFKGSSCDGTDWQIDCDFVLKLVLREVDGVLTPVFEEQT